MKKLLCLALAALFALPMGALAAEEDVAVSSPATNPMEDLCGYPMEEHFADGPVFGEFAGEVTKVGETSFTIESEEMGELVLRVTAVTNFADDKTRAPLEFDDLKEGDTVKVWTSRAVNASLPPQTNAYGVLVDPEEVSTAYFYECGSIGEENDAGRYTLTDTEPGMELTVTAETEITYALQETMRPGMYYFAWIDGDIAESYPAQAAADDLVVYTRTIVAVEESGSVVVDGDMVLGYPACEVEWTTMLPAIKTAQAAGWTTWYLASEQRVRFVNEEGEEIFRAYAGSEEATVYGERVTMPAAAQMVEGRVYVPASVFSLLGLDVRLNASGIEEEAPDAPDDVEEIVDEPIGEPDGGEDDAQKDELGVSLSAEEVTPTGLKLVCMQVGDGPTGELQTGSWFALQQKDEQGEWVDVPVLLEDVAFNDEAYMIYTNGATEWEVNWEYLYGELPAGEYRIAKKINDFRGTGDYDTYTYYAEFTIG